MIVAVASTRKNFQIETNKQEIGFDVWRRGEQDGYREARVGI